MEFNKNKNGRMETILKFDLYLLNFWNKKKWYNDASFFIISKNIFYLFSIYFTYVREKNVAIWLIFLYLGCLFILFLYICIYSFLCAFKYVFFQRTETTTYNSEKNTEFIKKFVLFEYSKNVPINNIQLSLSIEWANISFDPLFCNLIFTF